MQVALGVSQCSTQVNVYCTDSVNNSAVELLMINFYLCRKEVAKKVQSKTEQGESVHSIFGSDDDNDRDGA